MSNIVISLNENILKVSNFSHNGFKTASLELPRDVANDSEIVDASVFSQAVSEGLKQVKNPKDRNQTINFLVESENVDLKFILVNKRDGDINEQVINEIKSKLNGASLDNLYFSYTKIAPFVFQFVGISKDKLEKYLEVSNTVGIPLQSVVPWVLMLPKYVSTGMPAIFVVKNSSIPLESQPLVTDDHVKQVIALSELNGIYFVGEYDKEKTTEEIQKLIQELSVYKRAAPINKIFTLGYSNFNLGNGYEVFALDLPGHDHEDAKSFDLHLLWNETLGKYADLTQTQLNLLNMLPLPAVQRKSMSLMKVGVPAAVALLVLLGGAFMLLNRENTTSPVIQEQSEVLSESVQTTESSPTPSPTIDQLDKADIAIRIENGAGIPGVAGNLRDKLTPLGYKVTEVGNSDETGRPNTLIRLKQSKSGFQQVLTDDLKDYQLVFETDLQESATYDALIVIGLK